MSVILRGQRLRAVKRCARHVFYDRVGIFERFVRRRNNCILIQRLGILKVYTQHGPRSERVHQLLRRESIWAPRTYPHLSARVEVTWGTRY